MKVHFLGTNGWYSTPTGDTPCILIDSKDQYVVFDAGNGLYKLDQYITEDKPISLFVSHFHIDHVSGFHTLNKFTFKQGLDIYVPSIKKEAFDMLVASPFTIPPKKLGMRVSVSELSEGEHKIGFTPTQSGIKVACKELFHAYRGFGYRIELDGKTICYSGDTGICDASYELFRDSNLLIHECSFLPGQEDTKGWGHVSPTEAAKLAKDCNVKKLVLTHFDANQYRTLEKRKEAEKAAQAIFPNTAAATDGMTIELV